MFIRVFTLVVCSLLTPLLSLPCFASIDANTVVKSHAISMHGGPKYPRDFDRFDYTSSQAKKGGILRLSGFGTFDSLNGFITKGNAADKLNLIYDSITVASGDEPFTQYGALAHTIEYPQDRHWVIFHLRPEARFHDGHPITAEDVVFTFNLLMEKGDPTYRFFYADVDKVEALETHKVKYTFKDGNNRELALSVGSLPILPEHFWKDKDFNKSSLDVPLGSGPYRIAKVKPGHSIHFQRVEDYWGEDLAVNRGLYNFDTITIDYYRDMNLAIEALKAGEYDYRWESSSKFWATSYNTPAVEKGDLVKREIAHKANSGMQAFVYNLRRPIFQDIVLREAMAYAFDFEWSNKTLFYGAYKRTNSYFANSDFAATGLPSTAELELLTPFKDQLSEKIFTEPYVAPTADGSGLNRPNLRIAKKMLDEAGYKVVDNQLYNPENEPIRFEILLALPGFERIVNPLIKDLAKLGIKARIRLVDTSQYINRQRQFDFDMMVHSYRQSESPGNELFNYWGSEAAGAQGSANVIGIENPVVDAMIEAVVSAEDRNQLVAATRALDRVLLHYHYVIPQWYKASNRLAHWNKFGVPQQPPIYDRYYTLGILTWWYDPEKASKLSSGATVGEEQ
ncbi:MAG: microcin C transport system substrate-binding protein [Cellvibrionaceae bacterium]|jgi:microcin C transport system substrate-binding protein